MTTDKKKLATRIQALLAKAASSEHEAEAAAFMLKAQQLMEEHQIEAGDLEGSDDPVIISLDGFEQTDQSPSWYKDLYVALGAYYGCKAVSSPKMIHTTRGNSRWGYAIELTGRESAIITTQLMFPWVKAQCFEAGRKIAKEQATARDALGLPMTEHCDPKKQARRVGNALSQRIWRLVHADRAKAATSVTAAGKNALVTQDRVLQVYNDHYGELKSGRATQVKTNMTARQAAEGIGLHRQTGSTPTLQLK